MASASDDSSGGGDHSSVTEDRESGDSRRSDSGSVELPSPLQGPAGDTQCSSVANISGTDAENSRAYARSFEVSQNAPILPRVHLINADRQRLATLSKLLKVEVGATALDCCTVFMNEILQDFPAQVFLQEPGITEALINIIENASKLEEQSELTANSLKCLFYISNKLVKQLHKYRDPNLVACSEEVQDTQASRRSWSLLEFCWAGLSTACLCLRTSDLSSVLGEAINLLESCLATHTSFYPDACNNELGRLALQLADIVTSKPPTFIYLQVLHLIKQYILQRRAILKQSEILVTVIQDAVTSAGIWCLNPDLAQQFIVLLKDVPRDDQFWNNISAITKLCQALTSANKIYNSAGKNVNRQLVKEAVTSLDFLAEKQVTEFCVEALARAQDWETGDIMLTLLAHNNSTVQVTAYQYCRHVVVASIGAGQAKDPISYTPENITFLSDDKVLQEIICFGLQNQEIQQLAEDILVHIIKCRLLVPPLLWSHISSCLAFLIPFLASATSSSKTIYKALFNYLNPESRNISSFQCTRGNACLLFSPDENIRTEATRRLIWILEKHSECHLKWPELAPIKIDSAMSSSCIIDEPIVLINDACSIFYNEASLRQIVGLLGTGCTDPSVRYSALCQVAAMLQESRLLPAFLAAGGVDVCVQLLDDALVKLNTDVLSKTVKPIIILLSRVLSSDLSTCHTLAENENLLFNVIRAMFLYSSIDCDFQQYHSSLLALLLFSDVLRKKPSQPVEERLVLPRQLLENLKLPIKVGSYAKVSNHIPPDCWQQLRTVVGRGSDNLSMLFRCHLTLEKLGSLIRIVDVENVGLLNRREAKFLLQFDAAASLKNALHEVQTATSHLQVFRALSVIRSYFKCPLSVSLSSLPWRESFARFLAQPPATEADATLLAAVVTLLAQSDTADWLNNQDIISKLDSRQIKTVDTFLPLLQYSAKAMDESSAAKTIVILCKLLGSCGDTLDSDLLRNILLCLTEVMREHNIQLSSRIMADFVAPLVDIVCRFNSDSTYVNLSLIEAALQCLCLIQCNNLKNFTHHFCAFSENCDIFTILLQIISSDKIIARASSLTLLAGLATCNGMKNNTMDLAAYIQKSLSLAMDKNETCLLRHQSVVFLSSVISNPVTIPDVNIFINVLAEHHWFEHIAALSDGLYLKETFEFSSLYIPTPSDSPGDVVRHIVTPEYLAALYKFIYNLSITAPTTVMSRIKEFGIFKHAMHALSACIADTSDLRPDICNLVNQAANLISFCLISDEDDGLVNELNNFPYIAPQIVKLLSMEAMEELSSSIFWLIIAMEQAGHGAQFALAFQHGLFWTPLCDALAAEVSQKAALLLIRALALQTKSSRAQNDSEEIDCGCERVCTSLIQQLQKEESHQAAMAALSGLLAGWPLVRKTALRQGLLENIVVALRLCCNGLLLVPDTRPLAISSAQMNQLIEELIDSFELLVGFLLNDTSVKRSASETILAEEVNSLWPFCMLNTKLRDATLKFLVVYTLDCEEACASLLLRQQTVGGVKVKRCASSTTLMHNLILLTNKEIAGNSLAPAGLALRILKHCCAVAECRAVLVKTNILSEIFVRGAGISRLAVVIQNSSLLLVERLTRHPEGQLALARIPEALETLSVLATELKTDSESSLLATEILRNLCFCQGNRVLILTSGVIIACFLHILESGGSSRVKLIAAAVWSLAANHHRNKQALKVSGFQQALTKARQRCDCQDTTSVLDSALSTLMA